MEQDKMINSIYDSPDFLPFTNDNIFMNVMRSPKICRGILELVLPNEEFGEIRIMKCKPARIWYWASGRGIIMQTWTWIPSNRVSNMTS